MPAVPLRRTVRAAALAATVATAVAVLTLPAEAAPAAAPEVAAPRATAAAATDTSSTYALLRGQQMVRAGTSTTQPSYLRSAGLPSGPDDTINSGNGTYLVLQGDGNLVEYETTTGAVLFATYTTTGVRLKYQDDGNVVLYDAANRPLWYTGTNGDTRGTVFSSYGNGQLIIQDAAANVLYATGRAVTAGPGLMIGEADSPNGRYRLVPQTDGNLVAYTASGRPFWYTATAGYGRVRLVAQRDGNLVLYSAGTGQALWNSGTWGNVTAYYQLDMQDDGNIVLYQTNGSVRLGWVWQSGTRGGA